MLILPARNKILEIEKGRFVLFSLIHSVLFFLFSLSAVAQVSHNSEIPEAEFGIIPDSLFSMREYAADPSAPYFYAFKGVAISFEEDEQSVVALLNYHFRIKVFDADAREASIVTVPYYFDQEMETIAGIRGYTYRPDGSRVALDPGEIRTINLNTRYNVKEFSMPEVENGSILEYSYQIRRRYIEELPDFYLSHQAPTAVARATVRYPDYLRYEGVVLNFDHEIQHLEQQVDTSSVPLVFSLPRPEPMLVEHWIARGIPAVEEESFISSLDDYRGKIKFQLQEFGIPRQTLENSWDLVVARIRREQSPWSVIDSYDRARDLGREIATGMQDDPAAVQDSIFRYLNETANYDQVQTPYSRTSEESVFDGSPASQAAINQVLVAMLNGAGIDAWPLLISTREFGRINRSFPSRFQFNGQVVYSEIDDRSYFMDASFPHSIPDLLPVGSYNESGLVLRSDSYSWIDIQPLKSLFAIQIELNGELNREGDLRGRVSATHFGYPAQRIREDVAMGETAEFIIREVLFNGYSGIELENERIWNLRAYGDSVGLQADFIIENYATSFADGLEYRPMIVGYLMSNPFGDGSRELPVTLDAPERLDLQYEVNLPEGYTLGEGAQNRSIALPGAELEERYLIGQQQVSYGYHIDISRKQFEPEMYSQLLNLYERWVDLSNMVWQISRE